MAPKHNDGIKSPHGTLIPNVKINKQNLTMNVRMSNQTALYTPGPAAAISIAEFTSVKFLL